jgi:hypothetical protein
MIFILLFGLGMAFFGVVMFLKPNRFSDGIISFSEKSWFHLTEIISRLVFGLAFILVADQTDYALTITIIGIIIIAAGFILILIGEERHRRFAVFVSNYLRDKFRYIGIFALVLGLVVSFMGIG